MEHIILWLEQNMLPCLNKIWFGIICPGCGLQRSVISLLRGNFTDCLHQYPPLPLLLGTVMVLGFHLTKGSATSLFVLKLFYFATVTTILINYITNLISH